MSALVEAELELPVLSGALFVFCNKGRDKLKLLYWDNTGFALWYKRLDKYKFKWHKLIRYVDDGRLSIDNNRAEGAVKPFVIGRNNWLFSQTANGAHASARLYNIVETAKVNGLIPFDYIMACLNELCQPALDIDSLLPWNVKQ
ncbi:IS66 family insertion sequence element accessory protein TnpB [Shewanella inventionis]|nr:IS66 family insertion sequence element accessory protein TnpB [Shewanella inventionis]MCL1159411.1 IS66 family insertion sequence element accessory protein TnpB [Shewanella inventionis]